MFEKSGPSLNQHFESQKKVFSVLTVFYIMEKMVWSLIAFSRDNLAYSCNYLKNFIKPASCMETSNLVRSL